MNGAASAPERHVLVVITGGTICMQDSPDGLVPTKDFAYNCLQGSADFDDGQPLQSTPAINENGDGIDAVTLRASLMSSSEHKYRYSVLEFAALIDSSSMDGDHWNRILRCLASNWTAFDAFVVLHGTDTLAYTASALAFMLGDIDKTVIITGSQLSMYAPDNDAHDNLLDSLTVAATYQVPEVGVVFHHHLYRATRVTKVSAYSMAAFTTPNARPLALVRHGGTGSSWTAHIESGTISLADATRVSRAKATSNGVAHAASTMDTGRVAVLKVYPGISASLIDSIVRIPRLGGLVLETFGAGNIPIGTGGKDLLDILSAAVASGIVVVSVTQCLTGSVTSAYESARKMERQGIVTGLDMTTEAAYTKLAYLLSLDSMTQADVAQKMRQNIRGELTADFREGQRHRDSMSRSSRPRVEP